MIFQPVFTRVVGPVLTGGLGWYGLVIAEFQYSLDYTDGRNSFYLPIVN